MHRFTGPLGQHRRRADFVPDSAELVEAFSRQDERKVPARENPVDDIPLLRDEADRIELRRHIQPARQSGQVSG